MKPKPAHKRDENEDAYAVVTAATEKPDDLPAGMEAAWADWSGRIQGTDGRTRTLLRAAFEAGYDAGRRALGMLGASKGGQARAASLSGARRKLIARKAAQARWGGRKKK